ncbi:adenosylcobinamide-GDP ribazoletransferase [Mameliella sediminis]|uniref:adenosylcobinamide-GDP ribazoletransferase n=1 Tax=Mameliella sediminis TaxID=2836866 RepID=UPI001C43B497|nr:adenosylcobinamide-GDP ribazoletransferase [Mameliella sediminis]MBY6114656.1 adenosylcobinamide-GDP ribazoletransferase [Antarctobacter heliothermus]MBY6144229.1 adenosylcobinamide-GDP ribazoletransferase [Mameliella alba]MBV7392863.1 adenosylcobinamide-GDP ribazoletransferase [Mameliella sediminis]MBY6161479.1 adenosylcobinamide-GDP ribazoletransferase [Mameliella alba]MBY6170055.1 adenosylcobinamide-GDP ribazoletransferase [Mameliella alba]
MPAALRLEVQLFLLAVQYLTRLPVPRDLPVSDDLMVRAVKYHPAVGALVGGIGALVLWAAVPVLPWSAALILSLAATLLATAAFHEAGLADAAEGLAVGRDRAEVMSIMDGTRLGTYGALALSLVTGLKLALLSGFPPEVAGAALIAGHAVGRMASVHVTLTTVYARSEGMQKFVPKVTPDGYRVALAITLLVLAGLTLEVGGGATICAFLVGTVLAQAFRAWFVARIDGYTGDCLGGSQQTGELGVYLGLALWL